MAINPDIFLGNIIMSRVRLARNFKNYPFKIKDQLDAKEIIKQVNRALVKTDTFNLYYVSNLTETKLEAMKERHLISQNLIQNKFSGAVLINTDESLSIMINEEDVLREQCFMKGLRLKEAYKRLSAVDDAIENGLDYAYSDKFGYLTACPTNLGTGLRASVMLFLPALTESGKIKELVFEAEKLGLTVRGVYGEGSKGEGYMYQVSNEVTLGISEYDIIDTVTQTVEQICVAERKEMERIYTRNELKTMDRARRSFGVLTNAVMLDYSDFLDHIAWVKLGAMLGMISISDIDAIDDLIISVRPASLSEQYGKRLSALDRDLFRAKVVSGKLLKIKE